MRKALAISLLAFASKLPAQVTFDRILGAVKEPQNWLTYSGNLNGQRYSPLTQITPANVKNLELQWVFQAQSFEKFEATPLVVDGIMYTVQAPNDAVAFDAVTGRMLWISSYAPSRDSRPCCGRVNRGLAILGDKLFMGTIDNHVLALDTKTGKVLWNVKLAEPTAGYAITLAPLIVKDKVIVGTAGGEYGIRGFVSALYAETGKEAWRFETIPKPGEPGSETWAGDSWKQGGGSIWVTGSYDPDLNLTYWGTGNPGPDWNGDLRAGDNLYTDSAVALDADTGKMKWHYQFTPHDEFDYDATQVPVLAEINWKGSPRKVVMFANRNGIFYVLDRVTGEFLLGKPFAEVNWMDSFDAKGKPHTVMGNVPTTEGAVIKPGHQGATNWYPPSYSPRTGFFYIPVWEYSSIYYKQPVKFTEGRMYAGAMPKDAVPMMKMGPINQRREDEGYGAVRAVDVKTGDRKWEFKMADVTDAGILTTASDVLFTGGREGYFFALDARDGKMLWKARVGSQVPAGPMSYSVNGKQYVEITAGNVMFVYALRE